MNREEKRGPSCTPHDLWVGPPEKPADPATVYIVGEIDPRRTMTFRGSIADLTKLRVVAGSSRVGMIEAQRFRGLTMAGSSQISEDPGTTQARTGLFNDGIHAFLSVRERTDGRWVYTAGRMGSWDTFSPLAVAEAANEAEGLTTAADRWGGSDIATGSARVAGSTTPPDTMFDLANATRRSRR